MPLYTFKDQQISEVPSTNFLTEGILERQDIQAALRDRIDVISPETLIISEEFSGWTEGARRIDLLGIDKQARLVVIELKRDESGSHMELQALRYAAVDQYLKDKKETTFDILKQKFPDNLHRQYGVFTSLEKAQDDFSRTGYRRYFIDDDEVLTTADNVKIAVCTQWGIGNIGSFLEVARNLGYEIEEQNNNFC